MLDDVRPSADEIRRQMQVTRQRVRAEVGEVVAGARQLTDWRYYPRRYPWMTLAAAALVGYAVIPRKAVAAASGAATLAALARQQRLAIEPAPRKAATRSMVDALLSTTGRAVLRFATAYAVQEFGRRLGGTAAATNKEPSV